MKQNFTILFDLDGTLADTMPIHYKACQMVCKKNGIIIDKINSINIIQAIIEISKDINKLSLLKQYSRNKV